MKTTARVNIWRKTLESARREARLNKAVILKVEQPSARGARHTFVSNNGKPFYIVTSVPKTLLKFYKKNGIKAKIVK